MSQREYRLERQQWIRARLDDVFDFFSDPGNLADITPGWLAFRIRTALPVAMRDGLLLDYTIRLAGLRLPWRSRIARWDPPHSFVDIQDRGPYALWEHTHEFRGLGGGVLMTDVVRYRIPLGVLGRIAHGIAVRAALANIFDYRMQRIRRRFPDA